MKRLHPIMFAGTGSDVGKSIVAVAFCRIFKQDGYSPAPFKAQNMALNSYATPEGFEIGRAQAVQAEAAGSISEINLRDTDLVNLPMARHAHADVILVGDIDRGGVFASVYGSIALQSPEDRKLIKGIIINKFRGDMRLFDEGRKMLEDICGVPVLGVIPYYKDIYIEEEDSVALAQKPSSKAVVWLLSYSITLNSTDLTLNSEKPNISEVIYL